jgi:ABC-2 type transport system ATP-binding protein
MRQRLSLAQALMEKPALLLLDEPTNGLDPAGIILLRQLLRQLAREGTAVFLASHLLTEIERICDRVLLVKQGQVLKEVIPNAMGPARVKLIVSSDADRGALAAWAERAGLSLQRLEDDHGRPAFMLMMDRPVPRIIKELVDAGVNLEEFGSIRQTLEDEFIAAFGAASGSVRERTR